jgi:hypothetical protein
MTDEAVSWMEGMEELWGLMRECPGWWLDEVEEL